MARNPKSSPKLHRPSARTPDKEVEIAELIGDLDELDTEAIRRRWYALFGVPPPKAMRRPLLQRFIAHGLQVAAFGGLTPSLQRRLAEIAEVERLGGITNLPGVSLKPGTRLVRVFEGATHTVTVEASGFLWNGAGYKSLSAIAAAISGTNWNGWAFFGLKRRSMRNKNAAKLTHEAAPETRLKVVVPRAKMAKSPAPVKSQKESARG